MSDATSHPDFAFVLREAMEKRGVNQTELAKMVGVDHGTVSKWLGGHRHPRLTNAKKLDQALRTGDHRITVAARYQAPAGVPQITQNEIQREVFDDQVNEVFAEFRQRIIEMYESR